MNNYSVSVATKNELHWRSKCPTSNNKVFDNIKKEQDNKQIKEVQKVWQTITSLVFGALQLLHNSHNKLVIRN